MVYVRIKVNIKFKMRAKIRVSTGKYYHRIVNSEGKKKWNEV